MEAMSTMQAVRLLLRMHSELLRDIRKEEARRIALRDPLSPMSYDQLTSVERIIARAAVTKHRFVLKHRSMIAQSTRRLGKMHRRLRALEMGSDALKSQWP